MITNGCRSRVTSLLLALTMQAHGSDADESRSIEEVIVRGSLRGDILQDIAGSVSVLPATVVRDRMAQHVEQLLNLAPNVNFSAGASRGRFVQIRGVGERSQFVDPLDPSIGLVIDGIDLSGVGNAATVFDMAQIEVLRGPQGTRYGASAMGGMLVMTANAPTEEFQARLEASVAQDATYNVGAVISGPLTTDLSGRVALQQFRSDGSIHNEALDRDDTNQLDELTLRGRLRWQPGARVSVDLAWLHLDSDNGYDAFSLDNTRRTLSDEPGQDQQRTDALSLRADWQLNNDLRVHAGLSVEDSKLDYGYDEDWSFVGLCTGTPCEGWEYSSTDRYLRERDALGLDLRVSAETDANGLPGAWTIGIYAYRRDVDLHREFFDFDAWQPASFGSEYETRRLAVYADGEYPLNERLVLGAGLRVEQVEADYRDSRAINSSPQSNLWGGQFSARYEVNDALQIYALVSRGYKAGGFNGEALGKAEGAGFDEAIVNFLQPRLEFDEETLVNYELGLKGRFLDNRLGVQLSTFTMDRDAMQVRAWHNEGPAFLGYIDNADGGQNVGLELETRWRVNARWQLTGALGLLDTELGDFISNDPELGLVNQGDREQAQAPSYHFSLAADLALPGGWYARFETEGRDDYYFSDSHDARSQAYALWHATAGYRRDQLELSVWGRNLGDEDYAVRGFSFGNDPRKFYVNETYTQLGAPRTLGVTIRYEI